MTALTEVKDEMRDMRADFKELSGEILTLTKVMIRKEESDKHLSTKVDKQDERADKHETEMDAIKVRLRAQEAFSNKIRPWVSGAAKILVGVCIAAGVVYAGIKTVPGVTG